MVEWLLFFAVIIVLCVFLNNASSRFGVPVLLAFILCGMLVSNISNPGQGLQELKVVERICTVALIFIMFYGGFGTNWNCAKGVAVESSLLATLGVVVTAGVTGVLCHFILGWNWIESFLMGSVVSSTDAASVFSILRAKKLGLKNNSAPLLEMESGSNDPMSYMLTIVMLSVMKGNAMGGDLVIMLVKQIALGAAIGFAIAYGASYVIRKFSFATSGFDSLFILAVAILSYAVPTQFGGNGYLSAYIVGIFLGNSSFESKKDIVSFFDGISSLMQVIIFFLLGMTATPSAFGRSLLPAVIIFLILLLVARPLSILVVLAPFRKYSFKQMLFISFVGLRGAASIVFAIMAYVGNGLIEHDIFNVVFIIVLISIALQGSLIPSAASGFNQVDESNDVMKTFTDFSEENRMRFSQIEINAGSSWKNMMVKDLNIPKNMLFCLIVKADGERIVPNGYSLIEEGDKVVMCAAATKAEYLHIIEHKVPGDSKYIGRQIREYADKELEQVILIKRGDKTIVPHKSTVICADDIMFINRKS